MRAEEFLDDLGFYVILDIQDYVMDFKVYPAHRWVSAEGEGIGFTLKDSPGFDTTDNIEEASVFVEGSIKWDGCIDFTFPEQDDCALHNCGLKDFKRCFNDLFEMLYERAKSIPNAYLNDRNSSLND